MSNVLDFPTLQRGWTEVVLTEPAPPVSSPEYIDLGMLPPEPGAMSEVACIIHTVACAAAAVSVVALIITLCIGAHP